ncbi:MAG: alpha/beta fold hydrolase [Tissierellales bacterium]|nr:alpha/beta fold hydrolase [Tissierellales bacterium]MBN2826788.1 alpha/beta fold hydrolase [Tissierellales bacterium]
MTEMNKKIKLMKRIGIGLLVLMLALAIGVYLYLNDYYKASDYVQSIISENSSRIFENGQYTLIEAKEIFDEPIGLIFYPGGKVEARAYIPLLIQLADRGVTPILVEMPGNLAVLDINAADDVIASHRDIDDWYIMGHSLGGAMASQYLEKNFNKVQGLILLGAYPVNEAPMDSLVIYGTYDLKLDLDKVEMADEVFEIIDGNHAYFGDYGEQEGDGVALITHEEQQIQAVDQIMAFIMNQ